MLCFYVAQMYILYIFMYTYIGTLLYLALCHTTCFTLCCVKCRVENSSWMEHKLPLLSGWGIVLKHIQLNANVMTPHLVNKQLNRRTQPIYVWVSSYMVFHYHHFLISVISSDLIFYRPWRGTSPSAGLMKKKYRSGRRWKKAIMRL